jgi:hypothetical protein
MAASISAAAFEQAEAETWADFTAAAPPPARAALGLAQLRIGGGVALAMPHDPSGFWGLGFAEPLTAGLLEQLVSFYREHGLSAARIQLAPAVLPPDWAGICAKLDIARAPTTFAKLAGHLGIVTARSHVAARLDAGLRVGPVTPAQAREWAEVTWEVFGFPTEHQVEMAMGAVGRAGWRQFAVFDGETIVAGAGLYVAGNVGYLFGGATLERARRQGAQSALIAARAMAAREAGCDWLIAETPTERPGEHNPSLHNMERAGMAVIYEQQAWMWRAPAA